jgi:hypothetical protein
MKKLFIIILITYMTVIKIGFGQDLTDQKDQQIGIRNPRLTQYNNQIFYRANGEMVHTYKKLFELLTLEDQKKLKKSQELWKRLIEHLMAEESRHENIIEDTTSRSRQLKNIINKGFFSYEDAMPKIWSLECEESNVIGLVDQNIVEIKKHLSAVQLINFSNVQNEWNSKYQKIPDPLQRINEAKKRLKEIENINLVKLALEAQTIKHEDTQKDGLSPVFQKIDWNIDSTKIASEVVGLKYRCLTRFNDPSIYIFDCRSRKMVTQIYAGGGDQNEESANVHLLLSGDEKLLFCEQLYCGKHDKYQGIFSLETMGFLVRSYSEIKNLIPDFAYLSKITSLKDSVVNDADIRKLSNRFEKETNELKLNEPDYIKGIFSETPNLVYSADIRFPSIRVDVLSANTPKSINIDLWHLSCHSNKYQGPLIIKKDTTFKLDEQSKKNAPAFEALRQQLFVQQPQSVVLGNSFNIPLFPEGELHKNAIRFHSGCWDFDASAIEAPGLGKSVIFPRSFLNHDFYNSDPYEAWGGKGLWVDRVFSYGNPSELLVGYWRPIQTHSSTVQGDIFDSIHRKWINHSQKSGATGLRTGSQDLPIRPYFGGHSFRSEGSFHFYDTNTGALWLEGIKEGDGQNFCISGINIKTGEQLKTFSIPSTVFGSDEKFGNFITNYVAPETIAIDGRMAFMIPRMEESFGIVYNLVENKKVCDIYWGDLGQLLISLPENYYAATANAFDIVAFRQGNAAYPFEQFDLRLNRPDIVLERLGAPKEAIETAKSLREKRLKRMGVTEEMLKPDFHLPELQLVGDLPTSTAKDQLDLQIRATDDKYPLDRLRVYVNNVPVNGRDGELLRDQKTHSLEKTIPIKLAAGRNKIQVSVLNSAGAESLYANAEVNCTAERPKQTLYAVALGVSQYDRPEWCLKYAAKDATDLIGKLKAKSGSSYSEVKPLLLTDKEVTKDSVAKIKEFLSGATIDDTVLIFMAGHGLLDEKYDYYFGTTDIDPAKPFERGIPYDAIDNILAGVPSLRKALLMDTCHAGELDQDEKKELAATDGAATPSESPSSSLDSAANDSTNSSPIAGKVAMRAIGTRGMTVQAVQGAKGKSDWYEKLQDMFVDLRRGSGATVISSSQGAEYAFESSEQSNGLFTYALMEALDGKATPNKNGQITISAIGDYVKKRVQDLTKGKQNPNLRGVNLEEDFSLGASGTSSTQISSAPEQPDASSSTKTLSVLQAESDQAKRDLAQALSEEAKALEAQRDYMRTQASSVGVKNFYQFSAATQQYQDASAKVAEKTAAVKAAEAAIQRWNASPNRDVKVVPESAAIESNTQPTGNDSGSPSSSSNRTSSTTVQPDPNTLTKSIADLQTESDQANRDLVEALSEESRAQKDFSNTQLISAGGVGKPAELSLSQQKYLDAVAKVEQKKAAVKAAESALNAKQPSSTSSSTPTSRTEPAGGTMNTLNEAQKLHDELEKISKSLGGKTN